MTTTTDQDFYAFLGTCRDAVAQQVAGRTEEFQSLWSRDDDVVLIGAAGSHQKGWSDVSERLSWASQHLNFRGFHVESLLASVSGDLAFTVDLEHMSREVNGEIEQRTLRVQPGLPHGGRPMACRISAWGPYGRGPIAPGKRQRAVTETPHQPMSTLAQGSLLGRRSLEAPPVRNA